MRIGCDLDGTVVNTISVAYGTVFGKVVSPSLLGLYNLAPYGADAKFFMNEWVYRKAQPYRGAAKVLRALIAEGHEVVYITARHHELREVTEDWLYRNGFPFAEIVIGKTKSEVICQKNIDLMIEDAPHEVERLIGLTKLIILDRPYNRELIVDRAENWLMIPELVKNAG